MRSLLTIDDSTYIVVTVKYVAMGIFSGCRHRTQTGSARPRSGYTCHFRFFRTNLFGWPPPCGWNQDGSSFGSLIRTTEECAWFNSLREGVVSLNRLLSSTQEIWKKLSDHYREVSDYAL